MKKKLAAAFLVGVTVGVGLSCVGWRLAQGSGPTTANLKRNEDLRKETGRTWAESIDAAGLPNLHQVSPSLYRGAQPTGEGIARLKEMGVRSIINLRKFHSDRDKIGLTGLAYEHMYVNPLHPEDKEVVRFLQIVVDSARQPVFFHCMDGADRTGLMCAVYRVAVQGWTKEHAIAEWTQGGFGFHEALQNLVKYFRALDLDAIARKAGLKIALTGEE